MTIPEPVSPAPALLIRPDGELVAVHIPSGWVVWRTDSPRVQAVRVGAEEVTGWLRLAPVSPAPALNLGEIRISPDHQLLAWKRPHLKAWAIVSTEVGLLGLTAVSRLAQDAEVADWLPLVPAVSPAPDTEALRQQAAKAEKTADAARVETIRNGTLDDAANAVFEALGGYPGPEIVTFGQALDAVREQRADLDRAHAERDGWRQEAQTTNVLLRRALARSVPRTIPDDEAERAALRMFRVHVYGTLTSDRYDASARNQWAKVLEEDDRETWRKLARELLADLGPTPDDAAERVANAIVQDERNQPAIAHPAADYLAGYRAATRRAAEVVRELDLGAAPTTETETQASSKIGQILGKPTTDPAPAAADGEVPIDVVRRIKAEALLEARDAARAARRLCWAENREQEVIRHYGGMAGWLATRAKAIEAGEEPDWPDAAYVSAPAVSQAPAEQKPATPDDFECGTATPDGLCRYFVDGSHRCCVAPLGNPAHGTADHQHDCMCGFKWTTEPPADLAEPAAREDTAPPDDYGDNLGGWRHVPSEAPRAHAHGEVPRG